MRTAIACCGVDGSTSSLTELKRLVADRRPDIVLFAGGVLDSDSDNASMADIAERKQFEFSLLEAFFSTLGTFDCPTVLIPGPHDVPLRHFVRIGMHAMLHSGGIHLVHCLVDNLDGEPYFGVGGHITATEDGSEPVLRCSRAMADYFMQAFTCDEHPNKTLLLADAPTGRLGNHAGNIHVAEIIDSCHPTLCIVGGKTEHKGYERLAHTTIVNPGRLSDASAAWIDREGSSGGVIEVLDLQQYVQSPAVT